MTIKLAKRAEKLLKNAIELAREGDIEEARQEVEEAEDILAKVRTNERVFFLSPRRRVSVFLS